MRPHRNNKKGRWWLVASTVGCLSAVFDCLMFVRALEVSTPAKGDRVIAESTYTVEWIQTKRRHRRFEVDLYYCGSSCTKSYCGDFVASLCPDDGCPDSAGDYDVKFPEPAGGISSDGYVVRVADTEDESEVDCSDEFRLVASRDVPLEGERGGPVLEVVLPGKGDDLVAGDEYTVKFAYDNGLGPSAGRFNIDMYDSDSCGKGMPVAVLCDKPHVGCRSEDGDYEIMIPSDLSTGTYAIQVAVFDKGSPADCSDSFQVLASGTPISDGTPSDDDGDAGAMDNGTKDPSPTSSAVSSEEGSCSQVEVEVAADATSDYSGTYDELGTASGKPRFVRVDNLAVLQSVKSGKRQLWMLAGLETTFSVVSDVDHPTEVVCNAGSDCWLEETESGPVETTAEISCVDDPERSIVGTLAPQDPSMTTTTSAVDDDAAGGSCSQVEVEAAADAASDYSGTYDELGTASGKPRFVRVDNLAVLQSVKSGKRQLWMLAGLETTISVVSDADHPVDITCKRPANCWKEQTESGRVVSSAEISCTGVTK